MIDADQGVDKPDRDGGGHKYAQCGVHFKKAAQGPWVSYFTETGGRNQTPTRPVGIFDRARFLGYTIRAPEHCNYLLI